MRIGDLSFQSTLPVWGATPIGRLINIDTGISIHAPRVGSDRRDVLCSQYPGNFNPRSPCGERQEGSRWQVLTKPFQSTLPVWGATAAFANEFTM